jgi:hypothetical protein
MGLVASAVGLTDQGLASLSTDCALLLNRDTELPQGASQH